ncbi:MAG: gliding motility-associated C-terminal domain-containing protein, partial [Bacteroidetes bacterium]|nr:gliding motility-associated C-terminal domain-containing protein [Bacteroidota bacterium]
SSGSIWNIYHTGDANTVEGFDFTHTYSDTGYFQTMQISISEFNCLDTAYGMIRISPEYRFWVPNAFTPNGDGLNDVFLPELTGIREFEMRIYNRWGQQIFISNDHRKGWDGTINGKEAQTEVYTYKIALTNVFNDDYSFIGHVTLVR